MTFASLASSVVDRVSAALGDEPHAVAAVGLDSIVRRVAGSPALLERLGLAERAATLGAAKKLVDQALDGASATAPVRRERLAAAAVHLPEGAVAGVLLVALENTSALDPETSAAALAALVERELAVYASFADPGLRDPTAAAGAELRLSNEALARSTKELRDIKYALDESAIVAITDQTGRIIYVNDKFCEISKYSRDELIGQDHRIINSGYHPTEFIRDLWQTIANGEVWRGELRNRAKDGSFYWVDTTIVPLLDARGKPVQYVAIRSDITKRKEAEEAVRASEERYRALGESIPSIIFTTDAEGQCDYLNGRWYDFTAMSAESSLGLGWLTAVHPDDIEPTSDAWMRAVREGGVFEAEYRLRRADGAYRWFLGRGIPSHGADGRVDRWVGTATDVDDSKRDQERLREQATLLDNAHDAIMLRDLDQRFLYYNKGAERLYGWTAEEVLGRDAREVLYGGDSARYRDALAALIEVGDWLGELRQYTKSGEEVLVQSHWTLIRDREGRPKSMLAINTDVTERKRIEQQFLRAQRMESIGTLASGIAHDLNNILSPILTSIQLLQMRIKDDKTAPLLDALAESAQRGADLVGQVLSFARGATGEKMSLQPRHVIRDVLKILRETLPRSIQVEYRLPTDLWPVLGDPTQLHQVLMNLCVNARDAMPHGGRLTVGARNVSIDENYARMHLEARPGRFVRISVADTGTGIPPDILEKIFEPFFTTKEQGKGTGLGLSTVVGIVKGHGGFINAYSEVGRGTEFTLHLPAAESEESREDDRAAEELPHGNGELILVVDDEPAIREITGGTLEAFGYRTLSAADGTEAVAAVAANHGEVRAVVLDMMMPIMDGPMTIRALHKLDPTVKILGTSGLAANERVKEAALAGVRAFLSKPYTAEQLLSSLAELLGGGE